jgi:hypothetical protein
MAFLPSPYRRLRKRSTKPLRSVFTNSGLTKVTSGIVNKLEV